jgi:hypothetical protein
MVEGAAVAVFAALIVVTVVMAGAMGYTNLSAWIKRRRNAPR